MSKNKIKNHPACFGMMAFVLLLSGGLLQAQDDLPAESASPPSLLDGDVLLTVSELASHLSTRRDWMHRDILDKLTHKGLRLDEIFADAPRFLIIEGRPYRLKIGPLDHRWRMMDPENDTLVVFLTAEIYDRLGKGRLLAFQEGAQTVLRLSDVGTLPTLGLSLHRPSAEEPLPSGALVELDKPIRLGSIRWRTQRDRTGWDPEGAPQGRLSEPGELFIWQLSPPPDPNLIIQVEGFPLGATCTDVFGGNAICAEYADSDGTVNKRCCIEYWYEGTSDSDVCLEHVNFVRDPDPPEI